MSHDQPINPLRWKDGGLEVPGVGDALRALGAESASTARVSRLEARLASQLAAPTRSHAIGNALDARSAWPPRTWPWLATLALTAAVGWTVTNQFGLKQTVQHEHAAPSVDATRENVAASPATAPRTLARSPTSTVVVDQAAPPPATRAVARLVRKGTSNAALEPVVAPAPEAELVLLRQAQSALNRSASAALSVLDEHERLYPRGVFVQEREMLRIEAELMLGRRAEALARTQRFARQFEHSTYRARIDALLAAHPAAKDQESVPATNTQ